MNSYATRRAALQPFLMASLTFTLFTGVARAQDGSDLATWEEYDFMPGDTLLFFDDFSADPLGEIPELWDLISGQCEVVEDQNGNWLRATEDCEIDPYLESFLPPAFAVEFEANILRDGKSGQWQLMFLSGKEQCEFTFDSQFANVMTPSGAAYSAEVAVGGVHRLALLCEAGRLKCYMDNQRLLDAALGNFKPDEDDNFRLSQSRAEAVKDYLVQKYRLAKDRLQTKGWGAGRPLGCTDTPDGLEINRRVEFVKMKNQKARHGLKSAAQMHNPAKAG